MYFSCAFAAEHHVRNLQKPTVSYGWVLEPVPEFDVAPLPCHYSVEPAFGFHHLMYALFFSFYTRDGHRLTDHNVCISL